MNELTANLLNQFSLFDRSVLIAVLLLFVFAKPLMSLYPHRLSETAFKSKVWLLRSVFIISTIAYAIALILGATVAHKISQTALILVASYLMIYIGHAWSTAKYGREKEIDEKITRSDTITSESINLIIFILGFALGLLVLLNIWGLESWLQTTSVIGGILLVIFATKDYWLGDIIACFMLLKNEQVQPGAVIQVESLGLLGVINQITLNQVSIRDLVRKHTIIIPNAKLWQNKIEILSSSTDHGLPDFVDFNIGYGTQIDTVEEFLHEVWQQSCALNTGINADVSPKIHLINTGDHAVTWRVFYNVSNIFSLIAIRHCINKVAYRLSLEHRISLSTPITLEAVGQKGAKTPEPPLSPQVK